MATKVKGFYNYITSIFVVKEREMEIGCPTDVKHVAHIGWEGPTGNAPSWMKAFKSGPEYAATSMNHSASAISPWSSQGSGESSTREQTTSNVYKGIASSNVASPPKKHRRRKHPKSTTNSSDSPPSTLRSSRAVKSKVAKSGDQANPKPAATIEVS